MFQLAYVIPPRLNRRVGTYSPDPKDKSVSILLPDMKDAVDASKAASSVLKAVGEGELTPI